METRFEPPAAAPPAPAAAHSSLRESERSAWLIVDAIPGLVALLAPDGSVEDVNHRILEYSGKTLEELRRWGTSDIVHPDDLPHVIDVFTRSIAAGIPYDIVQRVRRADGVYQWFQNSGFPVRAADGRIAHWCVLLTNVDARKRAEDALHGARSELAHVMRATSLGALAASIAHEVNQPLAGIITNASTCLRMLAAEPPDLDGARETARRTIRDGNRAAEVVVRLRALFSHQEFTLEPVDLNDVALEVIALSLAYAQRHRVNVSSKLADLPLVTGDRVQLQQVIMNLLRNGTDAMGAVEGRPRQLLVSTEREAGDRVRLTVRDAGSGVDPANIERLFDPFYTTKSDGMGIGLSVSRTIVERHHGWMFVMPNDGPGTTFGFSIPFSTAPAVDTIV